MNLIKYKVVFQPLNLPAETANLINGMRTGGMTSPQISITNAFSMNDFQKLRKELQTSVWDTLKGTALNIGNITSFLIGMYFIFNIAKFIANSIINGFIISYAFGSCNYRILFSCWDHMISLFLHKENLSHLKKTRQPSAPTSTSHDDITQENSETSKNNLKYEPNFVALYPQV